MKKKKLGVWLALGSFVFSLMGAIGLGVNKDSQPVKKIYAKPFETIQEPYSYVDRVQSEPRFSSQKHLNHINIGNTWDSYRGENVTIAVIDSGINYLHEDFKDKNGNSIISELSAVSEEINYSKYRITSVKDNGGDYSILQDDADGHGTNVAATIAAAVNGKGTAGVAPNVELMFLKTDYSFVSINGLIDYAVDNGADIINMSFGAYVNDAINEDTGIVEDEGQGVSVATDMAATLNRAYNAGVVLVAAAGNENTAEKSYPACNEHVISVGALSNNTSSILADYSNHEENVDVVAPGSVFVADVGSPIGQTSAYVNTQGTSFSSPLTAGCIALMMSKYPDMTNDRVEQRLFQTAYDLGEKGKDREFGYGRVDVTRMLTIPVMGVSLSEEALVMKPGDKHTLVATIEPSNADNQGKIFVSENDEVAIVDEDTGLVTAVGEGTTRVGVLTDDGGYEAYCEIHVSSDGQVALTDISLNKSTTSLKVGEKETLKATITPSYATNADIIWSSTNSGIASVTDGVVTGVSDGVATITASAGGKSASCEVTVRDGKAKTISVSPGTKTVNLNKQVQFYATVGPEDTDDKTVTWSSTEPSVATIDSQTGLATSRKEGTTTIVATANDGSGVKGTAELVVSAEAIYYEYKKVTSELSDYTGQFLFVYEQNQSIFNGNLETLDAIGNVLTGITIINNTIESTPTIDNAAFTIEPMSGGYSIKNTLNKYISGTSGSNKLNTNDTPQLNTITVASTGNVTVKSNTSILTYNTSSGQNRFRYMKSNSGSIQLYKYTESKAEVPVTVTGLTKTGSLQKSIYYENEKFSPTGLTITANMSDGSSKNVTSEMTWTPSTMTLGVTSVTGSYVADGITHTVVVDGITVKPVPVIDLISISFASESKEMKVGDSETLVLTYNPTDATNKEVTYTSSNTKVATVSANGVLSAVAKGKTKITATSKINPKIVANMVVTVKEETTGSVGGDWKLVTDASTLKAGDKLVIGCGTAGSVAGNISGTILQSLAATFESGYSSITDLPAEALVLTLGGTKDAWTLANSEGKILGATAEKKLAFDGGTGTWSISITNNDATIQNTNTNFGKFLCNNNATSKRFTTYKSNPTSSNNMYFPSLYRLEGGAVSNLDKLIDEVTYADTCLDYTKANEYWDMYSALSGEEQTTFKSTTMEDIDGTLNLYDKLSYMKLLNDKSETETSQGALLNEVNRQPSITFVVIMGVVAASVIGYYIYQKKRFN